MAANNTIMWVPDTNVLLKLVFAQTRHRPIELVVLKIAKLELEGLRLKDDEEVKNFAITQLRTLQDLKSNPSQGLTVTFDTGNYRFNYDSTMDNDISMLLVAENLEPKNMGPCHNIPRFRFLTLDRNLKTVVLQRNRVCRSRYDYPLEKECMSLGVQIEKRVGFSGNPTSNPSIKFKLFDMAALLALPMASFEPRNEDEPTSLKSLFCRFQVIIPFHTVADCDQKYKNLKDKRQRAEGLSQQEDDQLTKLNKLRLKLCDLFLQYPFESPPKHTPDFWGIQQGPKTIQSSNLDDAMLQYAYRCAMKLAVARTDAPLEDKEATFITGFIRTMKQEGDFLDLHYYINVRQELAHKINDEMMKLGQPNIKWGCLKEGIVDIEISFAKRNREI